MHKKWHYLAGARAAAARWGTGATHHTGEEIAGVVLHPGDGVTIDLAEDIEGVLGETAV